MMSAEAPDTDAGASGPVDVPQLPQRVVVRPRVPPIGIAEDRLPNRRSAEARAVRQGAIDSAAAAPADVGQAVAVDVRKLNGRIVLGASVPSAGIAERRLPNRRSPATRAVR